MHLVAVGAGEEDALLADVKRAAVPLVEAFVGIFYSQLEEQRGELRSSPLAARRLPWGLPVVVGFKPSYQ
jgi:hypothetical protein